MSEELYQKAEQARASGRPFAMVTITDTVFSPQDRLQDDGLRRRFD
ncbi:MAG: hypothetical protein ABEJ65_03710 [bacterium]